MCRAPRKGKGRSPHDLASAGERPRHTNPLGQVGDQVLRSYPTRTNRTTPAYLSDAHRRMLVEASGIDPTVVAERGSYTAYRRSDVPETFRSYQRRAGSLIFPLFSPDSETISFQARPDTPRVRDGKTIKYEQPGGVGCILDVHPRNTEAIKDPDVPLFVTEGVKKADALTSWGLCAIALSGVWNWQRDGELLPDWEHVALSSRTVYVVFDSDVTVKKEVRLALERLTGALEARGGRVLVVYLPDAPDGSKVGVDDYLVSGGSVAELRRLARRFDPEDATRERLSRNDRLRSALDALWSGWCEMPVNTNGANTRRSVLRALILTAESYGEPVAGEAGVRVSLASRRGAEIAAVGQKTFVRHIDALEAEGLLRRDDRARKPDAAASYVLLASSAGDRSSEARRAFLTHNGKESGGRGGEGLDSGSCDRSESQPRASYPEASPELRLGGNPHNSGGYDGGESCTRARVGSSAGFVPELRWSRVILAWERDRTGRRRCVVDPLSRLGKKRAAILECLLEGGGIATLAELMERFAGSRTRPRDFKRRTIAMLAEGPQIVAIEGDTVRLLSGWREALEDARELGGEEDAAVKQKADHFRQSLAYRNRGEVKPDRAPTEAEMDHERGERDEESYNLAELRPIGSLAAAMDDYLRLNPHDAAQPAGWIATTLWTYELYASKVSPSDAKAALEELGGETYLRFLLSKRTEFMTA